MWRGAFSHKEIPASGFGRPCCASKMLATDPKDQQDHLETKGHLEAKDHPADEDHPEDKGPPEEGPQEWKAENAWVFVEQF